MKIINLWHPPQSPRASASRTASARVRGAGVAMDGGEGWKDIEMTGGEKGIANYDDIRNI